jgi:trigger factor
VDSVQVSVDKSGPCEATVTFSVPRSDFDREYQQALKSGAKNLNMKGFRPGKVPTKIVEREHGPEVHQKAIEHFMSQAYDEAVKENDLSPIGHERINIEDIKMDEGKDLEHSFKVSLKPDFELKDYKGLEVQSELEPVVEQEFEDAINDLRMQQSTPLALADGEELPEDGQAMCNITWDCEGETILEREGLRLAPLAPIPGIEPDAFKEAMTGSKNGDVVEFEITVPDEFDKEELRGKTATSKITITEAFKLTPPADEEIWKLLGVETQEEFDKQARERLEMAKTQQENNRQETVLLEGLIESYDFDLPPMMLESQVETRKSQLRQQLTQNGVPEDQHDAEVEEKTSEIEEATVKAVRALFLVNAIAEKEEIKIEEQDMAQELQRIAQQHQAEFDEVVEHYRKNNLFQQVQIELLERKVRAFLRENGKITEP